VPSGPGMALFSSLHDLTHARDADYSHVPQMGQVASHKM
jgi:hypothetical protein